METAKVLRRLRRINFPNNDFLAIPRTLRYARILDDNLSLSSYGVKP